MRRPSPRQPARPVVIVSGLGAPRASAVAYGLALRARGFQTYAAPQRLLGYGDVRVAARLVADEVDRVRRATGADRVHLVGMSLGGLIGLYFVRCLPGGADVARFVSVGGPLAGSVLASPLSRVPVGAHAVAQAAPDSELLREIHAAPNPPGVRLFSVGTRGDFMTPRSSWDVPGVEVVESPHGVFPVGHWMLFTHPGNHEIVARCLSD